MRQAIERHLLEPVADANHSADETKQPTPPSDTVSTDVGLTVMRRGCRTKPRVAACLKPSPLGHLASLEPRVRPRTGGGFDPRQRYPPPEVRIT